MSNEQIPHSMKKRTLSTFLKNKTRSYSAQAAITSFVIHLLLVIFAGSMVAVKYVQKQNAMLIARTENRPKLERKKIQAPTRVEQLQKRALTSKLVSKKVSVSNPEFVLPNTGKIGSLKTQKMSLPGADARRALSSLSRASGIGPSRIDFFGIRAEGEKVVFIIDASATMLEDRTGGLATYDYIKSELAKIVSELKPTMLFNLIFYDQQRVCMFRPNLVPATREIAGELATWMQSVNSDRSQAGLSPEQNNYQAPILYETAVGADAQGWVLAFQAAMEQQSDTIMMLGSGWGHHRISAEKATRMLDCALWELLVGNGISGAPALSSDRKLRDDLLKEAGLTIQQEERFRAAKTAPPGFVRDIAQYIEYSKTQVMEHLDSVYQTKYTASGLVRPKFYCVCLTETENKIIAGGITKSLWALAARYNGKLEFLRKDPVSTVGAGSEIQQAGDVVASKPVAPPMTFFGLPSDGSRVAFILDTSKNMITDASGGIFSYNFVKEQVQKGVEKLPPDAQFNVILYNGKKVSLFQQQMVAGTPENVTALKEWLQPVNNDPLKAGLPENAIEEFPIADYGTVIGNDSADWLRALQVAMAQKADTIFINGSGWGNHPMSRDKGRKLLDFSIWNSWAGGGKGEETAAVTEEVDENGEITLTSTTTAGTSSSALLGSINGVKQDKKQRDTLLKEALKAIEKEDKLRKAKAGAQPFMRDIISYLRYSAQNISEHLNAVVQAEYVSADIGKPVINYICLTPADGGVSAETDRNLRKLTGDYGGSFILFLGAGSSEKIKALNPQLELSE